jgi:hypothetical protein
VTDNPYLVGVVSSVDADNTLSVQTSIDAEGNASGTISGVIVCSSYGRPTLNDAVLLVRLPDNNGYTAIGHIN